MSKVDGELPPHKGGNSQVSNSMVLGQGGERQQKELAAAHVARPGVLADKYGEERRI